MKKKDINDDLNNFQAAEEDELVDVPVWDDQTALNFSPKRGTTTDLVKTFDEDKHCGDHVVIVTRWLLCPVQSIQLLSCQISTEHLCALCRVLDSRKTELQLHIINKHKYMWSYTHFLENKPSLFVTI